MHNMERAVSMPNIERADGPRVLVWVTRVCGARALALYGCAPIPVGQLRVDFVSPGRPFHCVTSKGLFFVKHSVRM